MENDDLQNVEKIEGTSCCCGDNDTTLVLKNKDKSKKRKRNKIIMIFSIILGVFILAGIGCYFGIKKYNLVKVEKRTALVNRQLSFCSELTSGKYKYSDVILMKKKFMFIKSYSIVKYTGIIRAGIENVTDISYKIDSDNNSIVLELPEAVLLGNEIVKQEVFDEKQSLFIPIMAKDIFDEIEEAKKIAENNIIEEGLLEDSWNYAAGIIRQFMYGCGFEEVYIIKA